jgi:hypothetical protein
MRAVILFLVLTYSVCSAQTTDQIAQATELSVPTSPAFNLLNVNPTTVSRPGYIKDFSLNSFVKDEKLLDNIALDAQPFWILLFKNKSINDYQKTKSWIRAFGNLNFSVGTAEKNGIRQLAYSGKITLRKDPMMDKSYINGLIDSTEILGRNKKKAELGLEIRKLKRRLGKTTDTTVIDSLETLITSKTKSLDELDENIEERLTLAKKRAAEQYIEKHWTDWVCDIGGGNLFNYYTPTLDSIQFVTSGFGIWINPAKGVKLSKNPAGIKLMCTGLLKWIRLDQADDLCAGFNIRIGKSGINGFIEYVYENKNNVESQTIAYGAMYKIDNKKVIEFGLRHQLDNKFNINYLIPTLSFNWALAKDILK